MPSQFPLTDDELGELDRFLLDAEGIDESMDVSMLDGFFAAILSGPKTILPSVWMRWVWDTDKGEHCPVFSSMDQAQRIMGLLMRNMSAVAQTLHEAAEEYEPLLMENAHAGGPVPVIDEWCMGYMKGVGLDLEGWLPITVGHPDWLSTIVLYGTEEGWERLKKKDLSIEEHKQLAAGLGDTVRRESMKTSWDSARPRQQMVPLLSCAASPSATPAKLVAMTLVPVDPARSTSNATSERGSCIDAFSAACGLGSRRASLPPYPSRGLRRHAGDRHDRTVQPLSRDGRTQATVARPLTPSRRRTTKLYIVLWSWGRAMHAPAKGLAVARLHSA